MTRFVVSALVTISVTAILFVGLAWLMAPGLVICEYDDPERPALEDKSSEHPPFNDAERGE